MFSSPPKRRKNTPVTFVAVNASDDQVTPRKSTTPTQASFQSPTKASLARSYPNLLTQSPTRSQVESRGKRLRQEVLAQQKSRTTTETSTAAPRTPRKQHEATRSIAKPTTTAEALPESFSAFIPRTFARPVPRPQQIRSPLTSRQPSAQNPWRSISGSAALKKGDLSLSADVDGRDGGDEDEGPELPPTPVQLGLATLDRPQGLAASGSSRDSRSGGGKRRRRSHRGGFTSSPSKLRDLRATVAIRTNTPGVNLDVTEVANRSVEPGSDITRAATIPLPEGTRTRQTERNRLAAQLAKLRDDLSRLETALREDGSNNSLEADPSLLDLLITKNPSCAPLTTHPWHSPRSSSPSLQNPTTLPSNPLPFLTLFAPGSLQLTTKTAATTTEDGNIHQSHTLILSAPPPWPAHIFSATFRVEVDVQKQMIVNVEMTQFKPQHGHKALQRWIHGRLTSPLHGRDVGSLLWGVGRWWEGCCSRAVVWRDWEGKFGGARNGHEERKPEARKDKTGPEDVQSQLPLLTRTLMTIEPFAMMAKDTPLGNNSSARAKQRMRLLLDWHFKLDWTGEVSPSIKLCVTGPRRQGKEGIEGLFALLHKRMSVEEAIEGVIKTIKG